MDSTTTYGDDVQSLGSPVGFVDVAELDTLFRKWTWECRGPRAAKTLLKKNKKLLLDIKILNYNEGSVVSVRRRVAQRPQCEMKTYKLVVFRLK